MSLLKDSYSLLRTIYAHPYNRRKPLFALYRLASWQLHKLLSTDSRVYSYWGTRKITCYPDSQESMWLIYNYYMDWDEFHFIQRYVRDDSIVFDIGANIGIYTLWLSQFVGASGRLVAFEPDPLNYQRCAENITRNRLQMATLEQAALSNHSGKLQFSAGEDLENHLIPQGAASDSSVYVQATTLDEYCGSHQIETIDFMKVDVEGAELMVLQGASNILDRGGVGVMQLELNDALKRYGIQRSDVVGLLGKHGYALYTYDCTQNKIDKVQESKNIPQNVYAIRNIDAVRSKLAARQ
jgi:FkbM family methyltransferase